MTDTNISIYAANIFKLAEERKNELFYNSSAEHAGIVHQALVKNASDYIDIFCSNLCSEISNTPEYCRLVDDFLKQDAKHTISILLTDYTEAFTHTEIVGVLKKYPLQVTVKQYDGQVAYKNRPVHFTVSDDRAFRLETDIEQRMAFGNFNAPKQAISLRDTFNRVFLSPLAKPVTLC
ncbi:MAG: hypothetical protein NC324_07405 [Bacteroides sp.]|nr:hypothetical protein [Bacteroides sp.]